MAEVKDKVVTVESLAAVHDYNEETYLKTNGALATLGVTATATELNYMDGVTSNVQTQLNGKAVSNHTHDYLPLSGGTVTGSTTLASEGNGEIHFKSPMYIPNETVVYGQDTDGEYMSVFSASSYMDNTAIGYDRYHYNDEGKGNLNLYGKDIRLWSRDGNLVAQPLGVNRVLWTGGYVMTAGHTCELAGNISSQIHGVVLVWSIYSSDTIHDYGFATHFIPKWFVANFPGKGMDFPLMRQSVNKVGSKYLYIHDDKIVGYANNNATGTANGVTYDNGYWVLRAVIGV